jgi:hypothetical protein
MGRRTAGDLAMVRKGGERSPTASPWEARTPVDTRRVRAIPGVHLRQAGAALAPEI